MKFLLLGLFLPLLSEASVSESLVIQKYVEKASKQYASAYQEALIFQQTISEFLRVPSEETLQVAKTQWIKMRKAYSPTEVYRFYGSPIDGDQGPEGLLNAWPLDEAFIDSVVGNSNSGIINNPGLYPQITKDLLTELNEKDGETNISVGYHALEFLLWGQDLSAESAGNRSYTDYISAKNADRRAAYLQIATELLVENLRWVSEQWQLGSASKYSAEFLSVDVKEGLRRILLGVYKLSGEELSQERMFVAYDTQAEEDEHSCFSDTTHFDLQYNFYGIKNVLAGENGENGVIALIRTKNPQLAVSLEKKLMEVENNILSIPAPFDNAIVSVEGRKAIKASVDTLVDLAERTKEAANLLGISIE